MPTLRDDILIPSLDLATRAGLGETLLGAFASVSDRYDFTTDVVPKVGASIREFQLDPVDVKGHVLLPMTQFEGPKSTYINCLLGHAFRARGYKPVVPMCYDDLPFCLRKQSYPDSIGGCAMCHVGTSRFVDAFGIEPVEFETLLGSSYESPTLPAGDVSGFKYRGVSVGRYAHNTVQRVLEQPDVDLTDPEERDLFRDVCRAGATIVDVANEIFDEFNVDATIGFHAAYIYGGLYLATARERGVPAISAMCDYYRDETIIFSDLSNESYAPPFSDHKTVEQILERPLSDAEAERIEDYINSRFQGTTANERYNYTKDKAGTISREGYETAVGLFSNVVWDTSLDNADVIFDDIFDWIETTVDHVRDREDTLLVVKPHPVEQADNSEKTVTAWFDRHGDELVDNIRVLDPDTEVDPYRMLSQIDAGLVYTTTLGFEMAYSGVPVVVCGRTHYRGHEFTYDPASRDEYRNLLERVGALEMNEQMRDRAKRYTHFFFFGKPFPLDYRTEDGDLKPVTHDDLAPGNESWDRLVERAVAGEPVVNYDFDRPTP